MGKHQAENLSFCSAWRFIFRHIFNSEFFFLCETGKKIECVCACGPDRNCVFKVFLDGPSAGKALKPLSDGLCICSL